MRRATSVDELRTAAWEALGDDPERAVRLAERALRILEDAEGWYVLGVARAEAGDGEGSIGALAKAVELDTEHADAWAALARALFDDYQWEAAGEAVHAALRLDVAHPEARTIRAWLRERRSDWDGAWRDYLAAHAENPQDYPLPVPLDDDEVDTITEAVIGELHPSLQRYLANVPILVDEVPSDEVLEEFDPPARPAEILGCFSGEPLPSRSTFDPWSQLPASILLFRRNLQRVASDRDALLDELRITLLHEIGHFLGLDEEDLAARGLD